MILLEPVHATVNFPFYRQVPRKSFLATVGYIALLALVYSFAMEAWLYFKICPRIRTVSEWAATSMPRLTLRDKKLSTDRPGLSVVQLPNTSGMTVLVDTGRSAPIRPEEMERHKALGFITQGKVHLWIPERHQLIEIIDLSKAQNEEPVVLDAAFYRESADRFIGWLRHPIVLILLLAFMWPVIFIWKHAAALLYSVLAILINTFMRVELEYEALYKLAVYAQTPVIVLQIVAAYLEPNIPYRLLIALLVVGVYLWQALRQLRPGQAPETPAAA